ncbi:nuclear transport factor 2 family protein [Mesorhizobium shangrilense]|uniref:Nuclear transport factor 2 family protein n=1 Tax=Mesorhizobium shangrilense TaxID=460060 RepID=A0ABV2DNX9_9HYPH
MKSIDYDGLMQANAVRVFSERDPGRRLDAIRELYTADAVLTEPEGVSKGEAAIGDAVTELLSRLPPAFAFTPIGAAIGHHGVGRLLWKAGPPNGPPVVTGMDIAHFKDGRIQALYVFLDPATDAERKELTVAGGGNQG